MKEQEMNYFRVAFSAFTLLLMNVSLVSIASAGTNLITNPGFESGTSPWVFYSNGAGKLLNDAPGQGSLHAGHVTISQPGTNVQLYQTRITLEPNTAYRLDFKAFSKTGHDVALTMQKHGSPYTKYGLSNYVVNLGTNWGTYSIRFTTSGFSGTVNDARLMFWLAPYDAAGDQYYFDNVVLSKASSITPTPTTTSAPLPQITPTPTPTPTPTSGNTYYVAKDGSGHFKTIQAAANVAVAGDIVYVKEGTYNEYVTVKNSGSAGRYITFAAYPGNIVTINGKGLSLPSWSGLFWVVGKNYIVIDGFRLINGWTGIHADGVSNIIIRNNYIENPISSGIKVGWRYSSNILVDKNTINRFADPSTIQYNEMISISNAHNSVIKNNHVIKNSEGEGIVIKDESSFVKVYNNLVENSKVGIYVGGCNNGGTHDIEIYNNIAVGNNEGISAACETGGMSGTGPVRNLDFHDNFASNNKAVGIVLSTWAKPGYYSWYQNIVFRNNKACNNGWKNFLFDIRNSARVSGLINVGNTVPSPCVKPSFTGNQ